MLRKIETGIRIRFPADLFVAHAQWTMMTGRLDQLPAGRGASQPLLVAGSHSSVGRDVTRAVG
jgi:hypothetical protein